MKLPVSKKRFSPEADDDSLEELNADIRKADADLSDLVTIRLQQVSDQIAVSLQKIQEAETTLHKMNELDEEAPAGLDFRTHLVSLQETLQKQRRAVVNELKKLREQFEAQEKRIPGLEGEELRSFFKTLTQLEEQHKNLRDEIDRLETNRGGLTNWLRLLRDSDPLYKSVRPWPDLRKKLTDNLVPEIRQILTQRVSRREFSNLAGDAEIYRSKFDEIIHDRDNRTAAGSEAFGETKQQFRQWLSSLGIERSDFPLDMTLLSMKERMRICTRRSRQWPRRIWIIYLNNLLTLTVLYFMPD